jgi:hypothetical protein
MLVVRLDMVIGEARSNTTWLHLSYMNLTTFRAEIIQLFEDTCPERQARGYHLDLVALVVPNVARMRCGTWWQTLFQLKDELLNPWLMSFYTLTSSRARVDSFIPCKLFASLASKEDAICFWRGPSLGRRKRRGRGQGGQRNARRRMGVIGAAEPGDLAIMDIDEGDDDGDFPDEAEGGGGGGDDGDEDVDEYPDDHLFSDIDDEQEVWEVDVEDEDARAAAFGLVPDDIDDFGDIDDDEDEDGTKTPPAPGPKPPMPASPLVEITEEVDGVVDVHPAPVAPEDDAEAVVGSPDGGGDDHPIGPDPGVLVVPPPAVEVAVALPHDAALIIPPPPPGDDHVPRNGKRDNFPQAKHPLNNGYMRVSQTIGKDFKDIRGVCWRHPVCTLSRQCKPASPVVRGRPIGLVWSFLESAHMYATKDQHKMAIEEWGSLERRTAARTSFHAHPKRAEYDEAEYLHVVGEPLEPAIHD